MAASFYWQDYQRFYPAKTGRIVLDAAEEHVVRLETQSAGFPSGDGGDHGHGRGHPEERLCTGPGVSRAQQPVRRMQRNF